MNPENRDITIKLIEKKNKSGLNELYIHNKDDKLYLDENLIKLDIVNFKITHHLYSSRVTLSEEYSKYGFKVSNAVEVVFSDKLLANPKAKLSFKNLFIEYAKLRKDLPAFYIGNIGERISLIEQEKPIVKEAFEILGEKRVEALNYNVSNIKRAIISKSVDSSIDVKIIKCLNELGIRAGTRKSVKEWKEVLQGIYSELGIKESYKKIKTAKATDLKKWFEIKKTSPKLKGKTTDCYTIIGAKIFYL